MLIEIYKEIKNYLILQVIDAAIKEKSINQNGLEKSDYKLVKSKKANTKSSLEGPKRKIIKRGRR